MSSYSVPLGTQTVFSIHNEIQLLLQLRNHPGPIVRYNNAILAIDIKSVSLNVKVQSALGLVLCNFSWYIFPGGPFKSTTEKKGKEAMKT